MPPMKFQPQDVLLHVKTQRRYQVLFGPDVCRLEADGAPAYAYRLHAATHAADPTIWVRVASEMEDGRFVRAPL